MKALVVVLVLLGAVAYAVVDEGIRGRILGLFENPEQWQTEAQAGDITSMVRLANAYENGDGIAQDINSAIEWYMEASQRGGVEGNYFLGLIYYEGKAGIAQDHARALPNLLLAARHGVPKAQLIAGKMHEEGLGIRRDYKEAYYWYELASKMGIPDAARDAERVTSLLSPEDVQDAARLADRARGGFERARDIDLNIHLTSLLERHGAFGQ